MYLTFAFVFFMIYKIRINNLLNYMKMILTSKQVVFIIINRSELYGRKTLFIFFIQRILLIDRD